MPGGWRSWRPQRAQRVGGGPKALAMQAGSGAIDAEPDVDGDSSSLRGVEVPSAPSRPLAGRLRELLAEVESMLCDTALASTPVWMGEAASAPPLPRAREETSVALTLIAEIRRRLVEARQEIARMMI